MFQISFLNAGILLATLAAVLPILIHLFTKQKPQKVYFSSLKFIKESLQERNKSIKLKNLLIIIIRTLIILLTILGISRPAIKIPFMKEKQKHNNTAVVIIIDNSLSMDYLINEQTELQHAKAKAKEINAMLTDNDISIVMSRDADWNRLNAIISYGKFKEKQLENINVTWNAMTFSEVIEEAEKKLEESHYLNKEIYVITDFQKEEVPEKSEIPVYFIPSSENKYRSNLAITKSKTTTSFIKNTNERKIDFEVQNFSDETYHDVVVQLNLNGSLHSEKMINIQPNQSKSEDFIISNANKGWNYGWVEVKNERFEVDNRHYFSFYTEFEKRIGVFSDTDLPKSLQTMLSIYAGSNGRIEYLNAQTFSNTRIPEYSFFVVYNQTISPQLKLISDKAKLSNKSILFILKREMNQDDARWIAQQLNITLNKKSETQEGYISFINPYHTITQGFDIKQIKKQKVYSNYLISQNTETNTLIQSSNNAIAVENHFCLWNLDFQNESNSFIYEAVFPVFAYRTFQYLNNQDLLNLQYSVQDIIDIQDAEVSINQSNSIHYKNQKVLLKKPGIYSIKEKNDTELLVGVNQKDFNESAYQRFNQKEKTKIHFLDKSWKSNILSSRLGYEIWKYLFIIVLLLIAFEMILIKKQEHRS